MVQAPAVSAKIGVLVVIGCLMLQSCGNSLSIDRATRLLEKDEHLGRFLPKELSYRVNSGQIQAGVSKGLWTVKPPADGSRGSSLISLTPAGQKLFASSGESAPVKSTHVKIIGTLPLDLREQLKVRVIEVTGLAGVNGSRTVTFRWTLHPASMPKWMKEPIPRGGVAKLRLMDDGWRIDGADLATFPLEVPVDIDEVP